MEKEQYEKIVLKYSNEIYKVIYSMVQDIDDANDIIQNVFMKLYINEKEFNDEEHLRRWLIRVAVNESKSMWASSWKKKVNLDDEYLSNCQDTVLVDEENGYENVKKAVEKLSPKLRIVIHLYYYENYSTKEIASMLNILDATVRTRLTKARRILKLELKDAYVGGIFNE